MLSDTDINILVAVFGSGWAGGLRCEKTDRKDAGYPKVSDVVCRNIRKNIRLSNWDSLYVSNWDIYIASSRAKRH